jgi:hypothetical protein
LATKLSTQPSVQGKGAVLGIEIEVVVTHLEEVDLLR